MSSIKKTLFTGVAYTAIARYSGILISLVITSILARILLPEDFGIVTIATVIISFFSIFTDIGISPAIIQKKDLSDRDLSNIFSFTIWLGIAITALFIIFSPLISLYYDAPILINICQLLSINLFFAAANIVPNALFYKNKKFKFIAIRSFIIQLIGGTISIAYALLDGGVYALIINPILSSMVMFLISIRKYPQVLRMTLGISSMKKIFTYSAYQFLFNIIYFFSRNMDKLLIGKYMNMGLLGYYEKSYRMMTLPLQNITQVITPVMHPIFSDFQHDINKLASSYERIVKLLAFIGFPLAVVLYFTSSELILILFGDQWFPSIPVFRILTFSVGVQVVLSSSGSIFQAANDTKSLFVCGLFSSVLNITGIIIGIFIFQSLNAIAWCICITFTINFFQCYWQMYKITLKRNILILFKKFISPLTITVILWIILSAISYFINDINIFLSLILKTSISLIITILYIQFTGVFDIYKQLKKIFKKIL